MKSNMAKISIYRLFLSFFAIFVFIWILMHFKETKITFMSWV